ncbi:MAG: ATP-dependent helicase [Candidatus Lindowbacteria bacterium]|nr:ATP-dependent helicase [Candidatus Lindowbacteria bacterium]
MLKLSIPRDVISELAQEETRIKGLQALCYALPDDALAALGAVMAIGREVNSFPETEIQDYEFFVEQNKCQFQLEKEPYETRWIIAQSEGGMARYLVEGLRVADELGIEFIDSKEYWSNVSLEQIKNDRVTVSRKPRQTPRKMKSEEKVSIPKTFTYQDKVKPTGEQEEILEAVRSASEGDVLKAEAFAGTGKTTLCQFVGEIDVNKQKIYLAFNKVMMQQANQRLQRLMECKTTDGLAYKYVKPREIWGEERTTFGQQMPWTDLADRLGLPSNFEGYKRGSLIRQVYQTVLNYCYTDAKVFEGKHVDILDLSAGCEADMLHWAQDLWARMLSKDEKIPVMPPQVMKFWDLQGGTIPYEQVLFDEAQDANAAFMSILKRSESKRILIGDHHQQLYEWRGAVDAMDKLDGAAYPLTQSWRFGPEIASYANKVLSHKSTPPSQQLLGNIGTKSRVNVYAHDGELPEWPVTILSRTNVQVFYRAVEIAENGHKLHVVGDIKDLDWLLRDALKLYQGHPEHVHHRQLSRFRSWDSFVDEQEMTSDPELKRIRKIIEDRHDVLEKQLEVLHRFHEKDPERAPLILSTTHRVKGREWDRVMLLDDFASPEELKGYSDQVRDAELNILYVAATRAVRELHIPSSLRYGL